MPEHRLETLEPQELTLTPVPDKSLKSRIESYTIPFRELITYYRCAMMEVETKFNVLNEEYSLQHDRNPISSIRSRLKSPQSIKEKLQRKACASEYDDYEE